MEDQFDQFKTHFKPKLNHFAQENNPSPDPESCAPVNGLMYETYGEELAHVQEQDPNCVWTVILVDEEDENGEDLPWYICKGFHLVNRHGYIITEIPWTDETEDVEY